MALSLHETNIARRGPGGGSFMQKVNLEFFYQVGTDLSPLSRLEVSPALTRMTAYVHCFRARQTIVSLYESVLLPVSTGRATDLVKAMDTWTESWTLNKIGDPLIPADTVQITQIVQLSMALETVLISELQPLPAVLVEKRAGYLPDVLLTTMEDVLPESAKGRVRQEVKAELQEVGQCLAFDIPTAAAFHTLRATELVMEQYYQIVCKDGPAKTTPKQPNWQRYIDALKTCADSDVQRVVALIGLIKEENRDLIMHPDTTLTMDNALTLFEQCKATIIAMTERLPEQASGEEATDQQVKA